MQRFYGVGEEERERERKKQKEKGWLEDERSVSDHLWLLEWARRWMDGRTAFAVHVSLRHKQGQAGKMSEQSRAELKRSGSLF